MNVFAFVDKSLVKCAFDRWINIYWERSRNIFLSIKKLKSKTEFANLSDNLIRRQGQRTIRRHDIKKNIYIEIQAAVIFKVFR